MILVSFDIDGTLEVGDPPGPIPLAAVRRTRDLGYTIGSASDRTRRDQEDLWATNGIAVDFVGGACAVWSPALEPAVSFGPPP